MNNAMTSHALLREILDLPGYDEAKLDAEYGVSRYAVRSITKQCKEPPLHVFLKILNLHLQLRPDRWGQSFG